MSERLWAQVKAAVDAADVEGLLAAGAPGDEYDLEIGDLAELVAGEEAITPDVVRSRWLHWFNHGSRLDDGAASRLAAALEGLRER